MLDKGGSIPPGLTVSMIIHIATTDGILPKGYDVRC
jgi:hypothetical protein